MWRDYWAAYEAGEFDKAFMLEWVRHAPRDERCAFSVWCGT